MYGSSQVPCTARSLRIGLSRENTTQIEPYKQAAADHAAPLPLIKQRPQVASGPVDSGSSSCQAPATATPANKNRVWLVSAVRDNALPGNLCTLSTSQPAARSGLRVKRCSIQQGGHWCSSDLNSSRLQGAYTRPGCRPGCNLSLHIYNDKVKLTDEKRSLLNPGIKMLTCTLAKELLEALSQLSDS
jgi:hypothetical protein